MKVVFFKATTRSMLPLKLLLLKAIVVTDEEVGPKGSVSVRSFQNKLSVSIFGRSSVEGIVPDSMFRALLQSGTFLADSYQTIAGASHLEN
jgi:hypothetical protein